MFLPNIPTILFLIALAPFSNAQIVVHHRPTSRIIAGCIVGGVFAIVFALIICVFAARARRGRSNTQLNGKPLFGGPWGRSNNIPPVTPVTYAGVAQPSGYQPSGYQPSGYYHNQNSTYPTTNQPAGYHNQQPSGPVTTTNQPSGYNIQQPIDPVNTRPSYAQYNASEAQPGPPAYGQEADYEKTYSPPAGPPPVATQGSNASYASPIAPPPVAHINGEDNTFVGGFHAPRP